MKLKEFKLQQTNGEIETVDGFVNVDETGMVYWFRNNGQMPYDWEECQEVYQNQLSGDTVSGPAGWATMEVDSEEQVVND